MDELSKEDVEKFNKLTEELKAQRKAEAEAPGELFMVSLRSGDFYGDLHVKALDWKDATRKVRARLDDENDELDDVDWYPETIMDIDIHEIRGVKNYSDFHYLPELTLRDEAKEK